MIEKKIVVTNANGLHMRPGRLFVAEAQKQKCDITVVRGDKSANAKSLIKLLKLGISKGHEILLRCEGEDEEQSLVYLEKFILSLDG